MLGFFPLLNIALNKFSNQKNKSIDAEICAAAALQLTSGIAAGWDLKLVRQMQMLIKGTNF